MRRIITGAGLWLAAGMILPVGARAEEMPNVPPALAIIKGKMITTVSAAGTQNYECALTPKGQLAWSFREPKAELSRDGKPIGKHYGGPTWEFSDGSKVMGQVSASAPGATAGDIPWLKLNVTQKTRKGPAAGARYILRTDTKGGTLSGPCPTDKAVQSQSYKANYVFVR